ncbi:MAG: xanthine dehydrogenase accessory protein XdhC [Myxococcales bacterium]|nr:xanthine dehydrogenase accessory protein XdhC [Myxococcales bacterium]MCB9670411.1 xanthine dehydrogenase accessory protein XdhC [Alphaproteobacteria bacterium]
MREVVAAARELEAGRPVALVFVTHVGGSTPRSSGARMAVLADGSIVGTIGGGEVEHRVVALAREALRTGRPARFEANLTRDLGMCCGGLMAVHVDPVFPEPPLVVFGAGHVAHAVVPMLTALGFRVTVVDDRDELNTPDRFACARVLDDPRAFAEGLTGDPTRYVLVVTHDHALDLDLCRSLLPLRNAWVGMIGSRAKVAKFRVRLRAAGLDEVTVASLRAPVGLDLRSETPAEIAVSIASEVVWHRRGGEGSGRPLAG